MPYRIPENRIPKMIQYSNNTLSDFKETFNLDMSKLIGSIRTTRMIQGASFNAGVPSAFAYYNDAYFTVSGTYLEQGGNAPDDSFSNVTGSNHPSDINYQAADLEEFNDYLYVAGTGNGDGVHKYNGSWTVVTAAGLSSSTRIHLMKSFARLLYIADGNIIGHITAGDVLNLSGTATFDPELSGAWVCVMLEASFDSLFIGYHNTQTNKGLIFEWDGSSENSAVRKFELESGILGGTVLGGIPYYIDVRGVLQRYAGTSFLPVGAIGVTTEYSFDGTNDQDIEFRPVHPNGIIASEDKTILVLWKSGNSARNDGTSFTWDEKPSGVYEYHPEIGMYHKYAIAPDDGFGDSRIHKVGALYSRRPNTSPAENGTLLAGASQFQSGVVTDVASFVFYDDIEKQTQKYAYFITKDIWSSGIDETWQKVHVKHKQLLNESDKVIIKYRTEPHTKTEALCEWDGNNRLITNTDLSGYQEGDEIHVIIGKGSGKTAHIKDISSLGSGYSVVLDEEFTNVDGSCRVYFDKWIKAGTSKINKSFTEGLVNTKNVSSYIEFKVCFQTTGDTEFNSMYITNQPNQK